MTIWIDDFKGEMRRILLVHAGIVSADPFTTVSSFFALLSFCHQDTHNDHRDLQLPSGDVLIHAGDFTQYGKEEHARDFNAWLGDPRRKMMIVKAKSRLRCPQRV